MRCPVPDWTNINTSTSSLTCSPIVPPGSGRTRLASRSPPWGRLHTAPCPLVGAALPRSAMTKSVVDPQRPVPDLTTTMPPATPAEPARASGSSVRARSAPRPYAAPNADPQAGRNGRARCPPTGRGRVREQCGGKFELIEHRAGLGTCLSDLSQAITQFLESNVLVGKFRGRTRPPTTAVIAHRPHS